MTSQELAAHLKAAYEQAPVRDKSLHMVLFGIEYAEQLDRYVSKEICELAGIGKWGPQLNLAKKLAKHVTPK